MGLSAGKTAMQNAVGALRPNATTIPQLSGYGDAAAGDALSSLSSPLSTGAATPLLVGGGVLPNPLTGAPAPSTPTSVPETAAGAPGWTPPSTPADIPEQVPAGIRKAWEWVLAHGGPSKSPLALPMWTDRPFNPYGAPERQDGHVQHAAPMTSQGQPGNSLLSGLFDGLATNP